jgi:hypothetical protein
MGTTSVFPDVARIPGKWEKWVGTEKLRLSRKRGSEKHIFTTKSTARQRRKERVETVHEY